MVRSHTQTLFSSIGHKNKLSCHDLRQADMDSALQSFNKRTNPYLDKETLNKMYAHMAKTYDNLVAALFL